MATRADIVFKILQDNSGRLPVSEVRVKLAAEEKVDVHDIDQSAVSVAVRHDNKLRASKGRAKRFRIYADGNEAFGYISLIEQVQIGKNQKDILKNPNDQIPALIEAINNDVKEQLKKAISALSWREFESSFLTQILDALGFEDIEITQATRDGGKDAYCKYRRGLVESEAIVSAKHWKGRVINATEIHRLRGIKGTQDTGIIVTSSTFSAETLKEAAPSQNQRSIVLIDGNLIVETCFEKQIGVRVVSLQNLYEVDPRFKSNNDDHTEGVDLVLKNSNNDNIAEESDNNFF